MQLREPSSVNQLAAIGFIAAIMALLVPATSRAQEPAAAGMLSADVEVLYPFLARARGGGVAAMGSTQMELPAAGGAEAVIRMAGKKAPVEGSWWFPKHLPMTPQQAQIGDRNARISLEISSASAVQGELSLQWRVDGTAGDVVKSGPLSFAAGKWQTLELPVPAIDAQAKITGLIISFSTSGEYRVRRLALTRLSSTLVDAIETDALRKAASVTVGGRAATGVQQVILQLIPLDGKVPTVQKQLAVEQGRFGLALSAKDLVVGEGYMVTAAPAGKADEQSPAQRLFVYPQLTGEKCTPVVRQGWDLIREGKRFGFVGLNYTRFDLGLSITADFEGISRDVLRMKSWGVRVVRVPLHVGFIQPAMGIFPDDPQYLELYKKHKLDPRLLEQLDYFVALAGQMGIYTVIDWHDYPTNPYRYFVGGMPSDREAGKPGRGIAYLAPSATEPIELDLSNETHVKVLADTHRWMAGHFRGNPNILGFEIPHNEPHTSYMAVEANWRRVTDRMAKAVGEGDPDRLTFTLGPSYSHNNLLPADTWLPPDRATGAAPHFYQANGPVPLRADAKTFKAPWLARDNQATFGWAFPAMVMPLSAVDYPFYNGEGGMHGHQSLLPQIENVEAGSLLMEAQLVQAYATGMSGHLEWTLWGNPGDFEPYVKVYEQLFRRFASVYEAGTIDRRQAEVAFVQNVDAGENSNGYNFSCIPFAKAALDLQLSPVHYLTDAQLRYLASAELSVGLEQVVETSSDLRYKAFVVDRRKLDPKAAAMLEKSGRPVLWLDNAEELTSPQLAAFLRKAGLSANTKSPREIQLVEGPSHLVVYRRLDGASNPVIVYPQLRRQGEFRLVNEDGKTVFSGSAAVLEAQGLQVDLPLWRSAILKIEAQQ